MDLSRIAAKQKRILDWRQFLETPDLPSSIRDHISNTVEVYAKILIDCWKKGVCSRELLDRLSSLERELEMLNDSVRLAAHTTLNRDE